MGKIKKFKEEFKEQNLLTKFRIIIISILFLIALGWVGKQGFDFVRTKVNYIEQHYNVVRKDIITSDYLLLSYEDKTCQLVYGPKEKKLGSRFTSCLISSYLTEDSVLYLYNKNKKGWKTFSLVTGNFSEEYFDHIKRPDTLHHYSACSRNGLLGFLNVQSGELAIPLQFPEPKHFSRSFDSFYHYRDCVEERDYIIFHGNYCIVPTNSQAYGVIDTKGKILLNGYTKIAYLENYNIFETCRGKNEHAIFAAKDRKCLAKGSNIKILDIGILNNDSLFNFDGDLMTDLTQDIHLSKYGYNEVDLRGKKVYTDIDESYRYDNYDDFTYRDPDANYMYIDSDGEEVMDNYTMIRGVKDRKNGRIVVENQRAVQAYKNAKGKYLFVCYGYDYDYEYSYYLYIDEDGKILFKKDLETI
ncbi:MAG: hypothetical protein IKO89_05375 [Bacteroidales bacterium]|nr:hypothetical protein [Bacteroidales bacterium]